MTPRDTGERVDEVRGGGGRYALRSGTVVEDGAKIGAYITGREASRARCAYSPHWSPSSIADPLDVATRSRRW